MSTHYPRSAVVAMYGGLALAVVTALVMFADRMTVDVLAGHIQDAYPTYSAARTDEAATLYVIVLATIAVLGAAGWLFAIRVTKTGKRWGRWLATALFTAGTGIALFMLLVRDTSGETGLAPLHGWVGLLPSVAGLAAVIQLWRQPRRRVNDGKWAWDTP